MDVQTVADVQAVLNAQAHGVQEIAWASLVIGLIGGLALFLLGLDRLTYGVKKMAGGALRTVLERMTAHRLSGLFSGALITAALNSSSVTTVLVVGFVSAGVLDVSRSVAVILGANIGSTLTAQLIAFDIGMIALGAIGLGFLMRVMSRSDRLRLAGEAILGLGLIFHGMGLMSAAMVPLRDYPAFLELMTHMAFPVLGIAVGAVFTALVQSSAATTGIAIALAASGALTLPAGIALILGANIGTCATALLASVGKSVHAVRVAVVHIVFNVVGVVVWLPFLSQLAWLASFGTGDHHEVARQLANAHTVFNVVNALLFLPFTNQLAALAVRLVPERRQLQRVQSWHLDPGLIGIPPLAFAAVTQELGRLGHLIHGCLQLIESAVAANDDRRLVDSERQYRLVDDLSREILTYIGQLRRQDFTVNEGQQFERIVRIVRAMELAGHMAGKELVAKIMDLRQHNIVISDDTRQQLLALAQEVGATVKDAVDATVQDDIDIARQALARKPAVKALAETALRHLAEKLGDHQQQRVLRIRVETAIIDALRRLHDHAREVAKAVAADRAIDDDQQ